MIIEYAIKRQIKLLPFFVFPRIILYVGGNREGQQTGFGLLYEKGRTSLGKVLKKPSRIDLEFILLTKYGLCGIIIIWK